MKKLLSIALFSLIVSVTLLPGCQKSQPISNTQQKLIGKWTLKMATGSYTVQGVNRKDTTRYTPADYFEFKSDGTLHINVSNATYNGTWKIGIANKLFITGTNYVDYTNGFELPILTSTDLQLYYGETTSNTSTEQKLIFTK